MQDEIWKPVVGYGGRYSVSNIGRVKSKGITKGGINKNERILSLNNHPSGYKLVTLCYGKPYLKAKVHRLVAEAFLGESSQEVDHINGNAGDNRAENLRYVDHRTNMRNRKTNRKNSCVIKNGDSYRCIKGFGTRNDICFGTFENLEDAKLIESLCDTEGKANFAREFKYGIRKKHLDTIKLSALLKDKFND